MTHNKREVLCALGVVITSLLGACDGCDTSPTQACSTAYDCANNEVCVEAVCRVTCNYQRDCAEGLFCFDGACVPGEWPQADASRPDGTVPDGTIPDGAVPDGAVPDGTIPDGTVSDGTVPDSAVSDVKLIDRFIPDTSPLDLHINQPPSIKPPGEALWTYPSTATQSYPVVVVLQVADPDDDGPYSFALADDSDLGCAIEEGALVYTGPELFSGGAICGVRATDSGASPATGPVRDFEITVRRPETSCWTLLHDSSLNDRGIGRDDGNYLIDPDGPGAADPFDAYCDMTTDGGGWTLAMRGIGEQKLQYFEPFWTVATDTLSHHPEPILGAPSEKYAAFNELAFSELRVVMAAKDRSDSSYGLPDAQVFQLSGSSLLRVFQRGDFISTPWTLRNRERWLSLLQNSGTNPALLLQQNCNIEGLNVHPANGAKARIGISSNGEDNCDSNDSSLGLGRSGINTDSAIGSGIGYNTYSFVPAAALVFVRDSGIITQQRRSSCLAHRLAGEDQDGLYPIDPDADDDKPAFLDYCDMSSDGGGWTLLATKGSEGELNEGNLLDATPLGSPSLLADFKSPAFSEYRLADVRFQSIDDLGVPAEFARYNGLGTPLSAPTELNDSFYSRFQRANANGTNIGCMFDAPISYHMTAGQISGEYLCESTLFVNPQRTDKFSSTCDETDQGIGPSWGRGDFSHGGCPNHWAESGDLFGSDGFPNASPFGAKPVQIWARDDDMTAFAAVSSCQMHYDAGEHISGRYTLSSDGGQTEFAAYCRMEQDGTAWMRVAYLDMGHQQDCPGDWQRLQDLRACFRDASVEADFIRSATFSVHGQNYSQVKGFVKAYTFGTPDAFSDDYDIRGNLDSHYVDGISISAGVSAGSAHIWTFAQAILQDDCPCNPRRPQPPTFVGSDYYCDSASHSTGEHRWFVENPLFDGMNGSSCYSAGDPGWFQRDLSASRSDDINVRLMAGQDSSNEDIGVTVMEIYIR